MKLFICIAASMVCGAFLGFTVEQPYDLILSVIQGIGWGALAAYWERF